MKQNTSFWAGLVLIVTSVLSLVLLFYHPSLRASSLAEFVTKTNQQYFINTLVHGGVIAALWLMWIAYSFVAEILGWASFWVRLAITSTSVANLAMTTAALVSGFIIPEYAYYNTPDTSKAPQQVPEVEAFQSSDAKQFEAFKVPLRLARATNQVTSRLGVLCTSTALVFWSLAMLRHKRFSPWLGWLGLLSGTSLVLALTFRLMEMNVHGMLAYALVQGIWNCWLGAILITSARKNTNPTGRVDV